MIRVTTFAGRRVAVFGLGASGVATAAALMAGGAEVAAWDDGAASRDAAARAGIPIEDLAQTDWTGIAALVLAPGVPLTHPTPHWTVEKARALGVEVIGDVELFFRERAAHCPEARVVAITGTNGKSTTTALVAHMLKSCGLDAQMGGNIGVPVLALAALPVPAAGGQAPARERIYVIEMSSFQIDLTTDTFLKPTIGVLLNITPDHLERHGPADDVAQAMQSYCAIKRRLVAGADHAVIGLEDGFPHEGDLCEPIFHALQHEAGAKLSLVLAFTRRRPGFGEMVHLADGYLTRLLGVPPHVGLVEVLVDMRKAPALRGAHNAENAAAAFLACEILGLPHDEIGAAIKTYPGLPHRMEEVGRRGRVIFINDSKATNADSTEKALAAFDRDIFWIAGGKPKEGGIAALATYFPRVTKAYLIGEARAAFAATLAGHVPFEISETLEQAVAAAARDAGQTDGPEPVVLLSPACASYDQFRSFEHRGQRFKELVAEIGGADGAGGPR